MLARSLTLALTVAVAWHGDAPRGGPVRAHVAKVGRARVSAALSQNRTVRVRVRLRLRVRLRTRVRVRVQG